MPTVFSLNRSKLNKMKISLKILIEVLKEQQGDKIITEAVYRGLERRKQVAIFDNVWPKEVVLTAVGIVHNKAEHQYSKLAQVKNVKDLTGIGLKEAKDFIDACYENARPRICLLSMTFASRSQLETFVQQQREDYGLIITL